MAAITKAQRQRECNRISKCKWPRHDRECAFRVLDLNATSARRKPPNIYGPALMAHVNAQLSLISQHHWFPATTKNDRKYRTLAWGCTLKILHAVQILGPYRNFTWVRDTHFQDGPAPWAAPIVITPQDIPIRLDPTMIGIPAPPMDFNGHRAHYTHLPKEPSRDSRYPPRPIERIMFSPTPNEIPEYDQERWERWFEDPYDDGGGPYEGFPRTQVFAIGNNKTPITAYACSGDGNCYWYAVAIALYGIDQVARFAEVKANIRQFFMEVLNDSSHPRYNTYVHLEANSRVVDSRPQAPNARHFGETSLTRCLHRNAEPGYITRWRPRPTNRLPNQPNPGYCLNQIVADYYDVCIVELKESDPPDIENYPSDPDGALAGDWDIVTFRGDLNKRWIYIFNTDEHFLAGYRPNHFNDLNNFNLPTLRQLLEPMPWHHANGPTPTDDLLSLPAALRHPDPAVVAPQLDIDHVIANRDIWWMNLPALPPPAIRDLWVSQHPTVPPFPVVPENPPIVARLGHPPYANRGLP